MNGQLIETTLVYGFPGAGKTSYIRDCIENGFFHKYGTTLVLCFEQGNEVYSEQALSEKNTSVAYHDGKEDAAAFCNRNIEAYRPDRIYVEMNAKMQGLKGQLPSCMKVTYSVTWIAWDTLEQIFSEGRQELSNMVAASQQITFRGCPSKELLAPYSQAFRLMNQKATYLRQDPMGYHEKAFDLFLPFSLDCSEVAITSVSYLPFWLDALDHPEHYSGKTIRFTDPVELRQNEKDGSWSAGRVVMTCCMADLQFMSLDLEGCAETAGWAVFDASASVSQDAYGRKKLRLRAGNISLVAAPAELILKTNAPIDGKQKMARLKDSVRGSNIQSLNSRMLSTDMAKPARNRVRA